MGGLGTILAGQRMESGDTCQQIMKTCEPCDVVGSKEFEMTLFIVTDDGFHFKYEDNVNVPSCLQEFEPQHINCCFIGFFGQSLACDVYPGRRAVTCM